MNKVVSYSVMLITILSLILIIDFQNSFASKNNNTDSKTFVLPFTSHLADQAKQEITFSNNDLLPFP
jgi:hypothetical protein